jgi:hypothetical protein
MYFIKGLRMYRVVTTLHLGYKQDKKCRYNVTMRRFRTTIFSAEKQ